MKNWLICSALCVGIAGAEGFTTAKNGFQPVGDGATNSCEMASKTDELSQKELFDMIRNGVVTIRVTAHMIKEKLVNAKMWWGTGFIVDLENGLILTNSHVVGNMSVCTYELKFGNGIKAEAKIVYVDPCYDFAILKVDPAKIPPESIQLELSNAPLKLNTPVFSMGNSNGSEFSTYPGTIFDIYSTLWLKPFSEQSFQFSGLTVAGASGSPVFSNDGKVLGLLYGGAISSGAALPIAYVMKPLELLKKNKKPKKYFFGALFEYVSLQEALKAGLVDDGFVSEYNEAFKDGNDKILMVLKTISAFDTGGFESGDVVISIEDEMIGPKLQRIDEIVQKNEESIMKVQVFRKGVRKTITIKPKEISNNKKFDMISFDGTTFYGTTNEISLQTGKSDSSKSNSGVYIASAEPGSPFMPITNKSGQFAQNETVEYQIVEIDGHKITSLDDIMDVIKDLFEKEIFTIKYIIVGEDGKEYSAILKHKPEFADPIRYTLNDDTNTWAVRKLSNPNDG